MAFLNIYFELGEIQHDWRRDGKWDPEKNVQGLWAILGSLDLRLFQHESLMTNFHFRKITLGTGYGESVR